MVSCFFFFLSIFFSKFGSFCHVIFLFSVGRQWTLLTITSFVNNNNNRKNKYVFLVAIYITQWIETNKMKGSSEMNRIFQLKLGIRHTIEYCELWVVSVYKRSEIDWSTCENNRIRSTTGTKWKKEFHEVGNGGERNDEEIQLNILYATWIRHRIESIEFWIQAMIQPKYVLPLWNLIILL